ncbi:MAG: topoisomerase C-terminal repeat-containing protein [Bacilli bacterium]|nr:topoisomerase C-terminal repeat-containing protein [Bacilli bacterium]MBO6195735.1 topoisomerase C-terminal repeat-containing protein [Bacilli bacterium]
MKLIIAEKPSLARNIVNAIGNMNKKDGYFENDEYLVTWAFGHLFTLYDIEDYTNEEDRKWKMNNLPFFPQEFKFNLKKDNNKQIDQGVLKQFNIIKELSNRENVDTIVNAGDSDREGEIIVRLCINNALKNDKKLVRLWLPDQTPKTVNEALLNMKDEEEYDNLANEGFARTYVDWLYGVNLTRYATLKTGTLLRVGRVIVPIVKAIYDRDKQIEEFVPDIYYGITSNEKTNDEEVELTSKEKFDKEKLKEAQQLCEKYNKEQAIVVDKKVKKDILNPPKLYSLTKLQNYLGKKYKMPMDKSLAIVQKLYEEGYLTYPRTNSEYLATNEKDKIKEIINIVSKLGYKVKFKDKKTIFDDSKIESHSALTPTYKIPKKENMSEDEIKVYTAVMRRFAAVFSMEDCKIEKTEIKIKLGDLEEFTLKGNVIIEKGWTKYDESSKNDKILPNLNIGDIVNIKFEPKEKKKSPPKHYTIETLNNYLKNPFKEDKQKIDEENEDDTEDYKAIFEGLELGTEATRTGIINNAINSKYIELKKDVYYILPGGKYLIEELSNMNISMDKYKTSELGKGLKNVYKGNIKIDDVVNLTEDEIKEVFDNHSNDTGLYMEKIGTCPLCGKDVVKGRYNYGCLGYKEGCNFKISFNICKKIITKEIAKELLTNKTTKEIEGFISKNNKEFKGKLKLEEDGKTSFVFD